MSKKTAPTKERTSEEEKQRKKKGVKKEETVCKCVEESGFEGIRGKYKKRIGKVVTWRGVCGRNGCCEEAIE